MTGKQPLLGTSDGRTFAAVAPFERSFGSRRTSLVQEFCADKGFEDGELVYEDKMIWFPNDRVLTRDIRASRYTRGRMTAGRRPNQVDARDQSSQGLHHRHLDLWFF